MNCILKCDIIRCWRDSGYTFCVSAPRENKMWNVSEDVCVIMLLWNALRSNLHLNWNSYCRSDFNFVIFYYVQIKLGRFFVVLDRLRIFGCEVFEYVIVEYGNFLMVLFGWILSFIFHINFLCLGFQLYTS